MKRIRFRDVSASEFLKFAAFALFVIFAVFFIAYYVVSSMPPDTIVMTTGREGLSYMDFGERYREILARSKVHLKLLDSSGSVENYNRLKDGNMAVDAGFVQGGTGSPRDARHLLSLGSVAYSPLWVFYTGSETVPANFYGELYTLREHIKLVRRDLLGTDELKARPADDPV